MNPAVLEIVKMALNPFVQTGVLSKKDYTQIVNVLKESNNNEILKREDKYLTRKELAAKWKRSVVTIRKMERDKKIFPEAFSKNSKKVFLDSKIKFFEENGIWPE